MISWCAYIVMCSLLSEACRAHQVGEGACNPIRNPNMVDMFSLLGILYLCLWATTSMSKTMQPSKAAFQGFPCSCFSLPCLLCSHVQTLTGHSYLHVMFNIAMMFTWSLSQFMGLKKFLFLELCTKTKLDTIMMPVTFAYCKPLHNTFQNFHKK